MDWKSVREELRPRAAAARTKAELDKIIQDMLDRLGLSHMELLPGNPASAANSDTNRKRPQRKRNVDNAEDETGGVGLEVRWLREQAVITRVEPASAGHKAGVRTGWIIQMIDGLSVPELFQESKEERRKLSKSQSFKLSNFKPHQQRSNVKAALLHTVRIGALSDQYPSRRHAAHPPPAALGSRYQRPACLTFEF